MKKRRSCVGAYYAAFGAGVLVAMICPARFLLIIAAVALVMLGISICRC